MIWTIQNLKINVMFQGFLLFFRDVISKPELQLHGKTIR